MKNKILISISGVNSKKMVMSTIVHLGYDFIEFQDPEDLKFKQNLFKDKILLLIHDLNYSTYVEDFEMIKRVSISGIKCLLIIDHYDVNVINDAIDAGANDITILPLKEDILKNKIKTILSIIPKPFEFVEIKEIAFMEPSMIEYELIRAYRGKYSISLIMVEFHGFDEKEILDLSEKIKIKLRETDLVMRYGTKKLLLVCPFTGKENIVEVENKVRTVVKEAGNPLNTRSNVIVYGITYPKDGENSNELIALLEEGIANSRMISRIRGTFQDIKRDDIETYKKIFRKK